MLRAHCLSDALCSSEACLMLCIPLTAGSRSMEVIVKPSFLFIGIVASWMLGYLGRPVR